VRIRISSHTDSGWPIALTALAVAAFILGLTRTGQQLCQELIHGLPGRSQQQLAALARADMLLVAASPSDQLSVAATIQPRGYHLLLAQDVVAGLDKLHSHAGRIGVIVIDSRLPNTPMIERLARRVSPTARVVMLRPQHTTADLVRLLLRSMEN
jgi:hypothetical protein